MKKLALMAAAAALTATPALAESGYSLKQKAEVSPPGHSYTIVDRDMENDTIRYVTTTVKPPKRLPNGEFDFSGTYKLDEGRRLVIEGDAAYLVEADGYRFYAPSSGYTTTDRGETIFVENGKFLRLEAPPEIVYADTDDIIGK